MGTGVASFVLLLFLLPSRWENAARASEDCQRFGQRKDCDQYDAPTAKERVCRIHSTPSGSELEWYTGTLDGELERCMGILRARDVSKFCPGYVGMSMFLLCDFANVTAVLYKDGEPLTEEANVTFSGLQKEDEGLYQCRQRGSLDLIAEFNMTVQSEIHIGGAERHVCVPFTCGPSPVTQRKCCYSNYVSRSLRHHSQPLMSLSVYGDAPVSISLAVEWITDSKNHYPTDLGPYIDRSSTDPIDWELNFRHYPDNVNLIQLAAAIVVTATNNISSSSVCIGINFDSTDTYNANTDLPQETNTTVSGDATFICEFGSNVQGHFTAPLLSFEISLPSEDGSSTTFTTDCREWEDCDDWSPEHATTRLSIRPINTVRLSNYVHYRYEVQLTNVLQEFNASQFSCSISTGSSIRVLQWKGTAELIVEPSPVELESLSVPPTSVLPTGGGNNVTLPGVSVPNRRSSGTIIAGTVVPVVIVLVLFTATSLLLAAFAKWRRRQRREKSYELAEVPLTTLSHSSMESQSPTIPGSGQQRHSTSSATTTEQGGLPAISIMAVGEVHRNIVVGREMLHETRSTDSGVSCMEDYEHNMQQRRPSNALAITRAQQLKILENSARVRLCRSEADIVDSPSLEDGVHTPGKKSVVYISYTDHASQWVRSTLKPMIDSWEVADVMLPERDMVAGKAISNERRRLIVEADKIVVVVSPDYYDSEWCSYELMHAIQNEPTLSRGRIIPVLIDGCKLLPKNMEVVVPLFAYELDFSQRLRAAICPHPTARRSLQY